MSRARCRKLATVIAVPIAMVVINMMPQSTSQRMGPRRTRVSLTSKWIRAATRRPAFIPDTLEFSLVIGSSSMHHYDAAHLKRIRKMGYSPLNFPAFGAANFHATPALVMVPDWGGPLSSRPTYVVTLV